MKPLAEAVPAPRGPLARWVCAAGVLAWLLSVAAALTVEAVAVALWGPDHGLPTRHMEDGWVLNVLAVVVAPLTETFVVLLVVWLLGAFSSRRWVVVMVAAVLAGAAHGPYPHTFAATSLAFAVYSYAAVTWWPQGFWRAYAAAAWPHAISNSLLLGTDWVMSAIPG